MIDTGAHLPEEVDEVRFQAPRLYPKQRAVFFDPARTVICDASTKAGKSVGALVWCLDQGINHHPGESGLWLASVYPQAKVMYRRLRRWLSRVDPGRKHWDSNDSELFIVLPGGCTLWFKGGDRPDSVYGSDYAFAVIDEGTRCKEEAYHAVESTLTATGGPLRIISNVKGRGNWVYRLGKLAQSGAPDMAYYKLTAWDAVEAGVLKRSIVEDAKQKLPANVFAELFLAEPADDGGNPFGIDHIAKCVLPMAAGEPVAFGTDLAKKQDWTVNIAVNDMGQVCRFSRWQHVPWSDTIRRLVDEIGESPALVDSTGVGDPIVEGLQRTLPQVEGFNFSPGSKQKLMEGLAVAIQSGEVAFPDGQIRSELEAFEYEYTRTGVRYSAPDGLTDDCVCALALAVQKRATRPRFHFFVGGADEKPEMALPDGSPMNIGDTLRERRRDIHFGFGD